MAKCDLAQDVELVRAISGNFRELIKDKSGINIGGCRGGQDHLIGDLAITPAISVAHCAVIAQRAIRSGVATERSRFSRCSGAQLDRIVRQDTRTGRIGGRDEV
jgi:hypothetical protein